MKKKLTQTLIDNTKPPTTGRITIHDTATNGLCVRISATGHRAFYTCKWKDGKLRWVLLGVPRRSDLDTGLTVDQARTKARGENGEIAAGEDPNAKKRARREAATLSDLWTTYLETYARPHKKASSVAEDERNWKNHLKGWGQYRRIAEITQADVKLLHTRIGTNTGKYAANRVLTLLGAMYSLCGKDHGLNPRTDNPTVDVTRFEETERKRHLKGEELQQFMAAVAADVDADVRDYIHVSLFTGARRANVLGMKWEDVDLKRATWKVPGEMTKGGEQLVVALAPQVVELLNKRPDFSPYVFPARRVTVEQVEQARALAAEGMNTRKIGEAVGLSQTQVVRILKPAFNAETPRHMHPPRNAWERILKAAEISERTTLHDLRRTFATWMVTSGASLPVIATAMGHKDMRTTQKHYALAEGDVVTKATLASVALIAAAGAKPVDEKKTA